jgi:hypothetical protein
MKFSHDELNLFISTISNDTFPSLVAFQRFTNGTLNPTFQLVHANPTQNQTGSNLNATYTVDSVAISAIVDMFIAQTLLQADDFWSPLQPTALTDLDFVVSTASQSFLLQLHEPRTIQSITFYTPSVFQSSPSGVFNASLLDFNYNLLASQFFNLTDPSNSSMGINSTWLISSTGLSQVFFLQLDGYSPGDDFVFNVELTEITMTGKILYFHFCLLNVFAQVCLLLLLQAQSLCHRMIRLYIWPLAREICAPFRCSNTVESPLRHH